MHSSPPQKADTFNRPPFGRALTGVPPWGRASPGGEGCTRGEARAPGEEQKHRICD